MQGDNSQFYVFGDVGDHYGPLGVPHREMFGKSLYMTKVWLGGCESPDRPTSGRACFIPGTNNVVDIYFRCERIYGDQRLCHLWRIIDCPNIKTCEEAERMLLDFRSGETECAMMGVHNNETTHVILYTTWRHGQTIMPRASPDSNIKVFTEIEAHCNIFEDEMSNFVRCLFFNLGTQRLQVFNVTFCHKNNNAYYEISSSFEPTIIRIFTGINFHFGIITWGKSTIALISPKDSYTPHQFTETHYRTLTYHFRLESFEQPPLTTAELLQRPLPLKPTLPMIFDEMPPLRETQRVWTVGLEQFWFNPNATKKKIYSPTQFYPMGYFDERVLFTINGNNSWMGIINNKRVLCHEKKRFCMIRSGTDNGKTWFMCHAAVSLARKGLSVLIIAPDIIEADISWVEDSGVCVALFNSKSIKYKESCLRHKFDTIFIDEAQLLFFNSPRQPSDIFKVKQEVMLNWIVGAERLLVITAPIRTLRLLSWNIFRLSTYLDVQDVNESWGFQSHPPAYLHSHRTLNLFVPNLDSIVSNRTVASFWQLPQALPPVKPDLQIRAHEMKFSNTLFGSVTSKWDEMATFNPLIFGQNTPLQQELMKKMLMTKFNIQNVCGVKRLREEMLDIKHDGFKEFMAFMCGEQKFECNVCYNDEHDQTSQFCIMIPCQHITCLSCSEKNPNKHSCPFCRNTIAERIVISAQDLLENGEDCADEWFNIEGTANLIAQISKHRPTALVMYKNTRLLKELKTRGINVEFLSKIQHPLDTPEAVATFKNPTVVVMTPKQLVGRNMQGIDQMFIACFLNKPDLKQAISRIYRSETQFKNVTVTLTMSDLHMKDLEEIQRFAQSAFV